MSSDFEGNLIILKGPNDIQLVNPFVDVSSAPITLSNFPEISYIQSSCESDVSLMSVNGKSCILKLILKPSSQIVLKCLQCFKYLGGSNINETIWALWRSALLLDDYKDDWRAFVITILTILLPMDIEVQNYNKNEITKLIPYARILNNELANDYSFKDMLAYIVISLHLIREEVKLNVLSHNF